MLSNIIDDLYKSVENNDKFDIPHLEEGSTFIRRLIEDFKNYNQMVKSNCVSTNKLGWLTSIPFPVTVEVINREQTPGKKVHVNMGYERIVIVYYGVSLELESFVNIVLWPRRESSNTSNQAYKKIYELVTKDKNRDNIIKFGKGFDLELSNSIHPSHSQQITRYVYDWEHVPFFKETGDTVLSHSSPLSFRKVYLDELKLTKTYINIKATVGRILSFNKNEIDISIPSFYGPWKKYRAKISSMLIKGLKQNSLNYFMILECLNGNVQDVIKFISPASPIDLMGHLLSFAIHTIRLGIKRLSLLRSKEYEKLYKKCFTIVDNFCRTEYINYSNLWAANNIFQAYLSPYFRVIDEEIFCVPHNQVNLTDEMLKIYDKSLCFGYDSIKDAIKLNLEKQHMVQAYHHSVYDFIRLFNDLKRLLVWNNEREYLYRKLKLEISN